MYNNTESTLEFLKKYVQKNTSFDEEFKKNAIDATKASEIYILFLSHSKIDEFLELIKLGIIITESDMNESREIDNTNAWFHTIKLKSIHSKIILFQLLSQNIIPSSEALELCEKSTGINTWHMLLIHEEYVNYVLTLLENNVKPSSKTNSSFQYYNDTTQTHDDISIWNLLILSKKLSQLFFPLMQAGLYPDINDLEQHSFKNENNTWYWMAKEIAGDLNLQKIITEKQMACPILTLIHQNRHPNKAAISQRCTKYNVNFLHWLAQTPALHPALLESIQLGLITDAQDFEPLNRFDNTNAIYWLINKPSAYTDQIFKSLEEKGIQLDTENNNTIEKVERQYFCLFRSSHPDIQPHKKDESTEQEENLVNYVPNSKNL